MEISIFCETSNVETLKKRNKQGQQNDSAIICIFVVAQAYHP